MRIILQTPDFKATHKLTSFVEQKLAKLADVCSVQKARVCLRIDKAHTKENKFCEIRLVIPGADLFASRQTESFEASVTGTIRALKHQLAKDKTEREKIRSV